VYRDCEDRLPGSGSGKDGRRCVGCRLRPIVNDVPNNPSRKRIPQRLSQQPLSKNTVRGKYVELGLDSNRSTEISAL